MPEVRFSAGSWNQVDVGSEMEVSGLLPNREYLLSIFIVFTDGHGEHTIKATGANSEFTTCYMSAGKLGFLSNAFFLLAKSSNNGTLKLQRAYRGESVNNVRFGTTEVVIQIFS